MLQEQRATSELHQAWSDPPGGPLVLLCEQHIDFDSLALILEGSRCLLAINFYTCLCSIRADSNLPRNPLTQKGDLEEQLYVEVNIQECACTCIRKENDQMVSKLKGALQKGLE